jgi:cold shock protein
MIGFFTNFLIIMQTGTVKFFNESKGFGFIVDDQSGQEIFVHVTALGGTHIRENDKVSFDVVEGKRGLNAENVSKM